MNALIQNKDNIMFLQLLFAQRHAVSNIQYISLIKAKRKKTLECYYKTFQNQSLLELLGASTDFYEQPEYF